MFSDSWGREGSFLLAASVGACEGEVLGLTQAFYSFSLVVLVMATLLSGHSDWVSYLCQALKSRLLAKSTSSVLTDP